MSALLIRQNDCYSDIKQSCLTMRRISRHGWLMTTKSEMYSEYTLRLREDDSRPTSVGKVKIGVAPIERNMNAALDQVRLGEAMYQVETECLVTAAGEEINLRSQSSIVLRHLTKNLGGLVTRDDLIAAVWPNIAVTDDSLTQCISDIRKALGDQNRTILKTVPKRGYILRGEYVATIIPSPGLSQFNEIEQQYTGTRKVALAGIGATETAQTLINNLPATLRPETAKTNDAGTPFLIYSEPNIALQAALHIAGSTQMAITVDYTDDEGIEAETLLQVAEQGTVLTSPDISAMIAPGGEFDFHDLGEVISPEGRDKLRPFRVTKRSGHPVIVPQLDARDILPTLAILPLHAQTNGADMMLGMFLADEISTALGQAEDVNVISRLSTASVGRQGSDLQNIGRLLNADFVLSGTLFQKDNRAIVVLEFAETETQFVLWSDRIELAIDPLLREIQGVDQITAHIRKAITLNEVRRVRSQPLHSLKLFSVLHGAVGLMHRFSPKEFQLARTYLEYVMTKAPNHPAPLAWLARWHVLRTVQGWTDNANQEGHQALELTARALDIDPDYTLALVCEGHVLAHLAHRLDDAKDRYDAALTTNPNDAQGLALRGMLASFQDRSVDGKRDTERALHLTPLDPHRFFFLALAAGANISAEDYPRAVTLAKESLRMNRTHVSTLRMLAVAQEGAGKHVEARETANQLMRIQPDLRVGNWLRMSPSAEYKNGDRFAELLRAAGIPE